MIANPIDIAFIAITMALTLLTIWASLRTRAAPQIDAYRARGAVILDVRTPGEFRRVRVRGAINIPVDQVEGRIEELGNPGPIILYCATGMRSRSVAKLLRSHGFEILDVGTLSTFPPDTLQRG